MVVAKHPDNEGVNVLARVKMNLSAPVPPITHEITADPAHDAARVEWGESVKIDVETLLRGHDGRLEAPEREEAEEFLREFLGRGPRMAEDVWTATKKAGLKKGTVKNAKRRLGIQSHPKRDGTGEITGWEWELPNQADVEVQFDLR